MRWQKTKKQRPDLDCFIPLIVDTHLNAKKRKDSKLPFSDWNDDFEFFSNMEEFGHRRAVEIESTKANKVKPHGSKMARYQWALDQWDWDDHPSVAEGDMPPPISNRPDHFNTEEPTDFDDAIDIIHFNAHWGKKEMRDEIVDPDWESKMQAEINRIVRESDEPYKTKPSSLSSEETISFEESNSTSI